MDIPVKRPAPNNWKIEDSLDLYQVGNWGKDYFSINPQGHVVVRPDANPGHEIDLFEVIEGLKARDLTAPVVIRFADILKNFGSTAETVP